MDIPELKLPPPIIIKTPKVIETVINTRINTTKRKRKIEFS